MGKVYSNIQLERCAPKLLQWGLGGPPAAKPFEYILSPSAQLDPTPTTQMFSDFDDSHDQLDRGWGMPQPQCHPVAAKVIVNTDSSIIGNLRRRR